MSRSLNYKVLKSAIVRSANKTDKDSTAFTIDIDKLTDEVKEYNLKPLSVGLVSHKIDPSDIPAISEYYSTDRLAWFEDGLNIDYLIFVDLDKEDENLRSLIDEIEDPDTVNKVAIAAKIASYYPCYFALVSSYKSNNPKYIGKNSYNITCRANKVIIKDPNYVYKPDKKEDSTEEKEN